MKNSGLTTKDQQKILSGINIKLQQHRIGLIGANGSGKSTLARLCNGLTQPSKGHVSVLGHDSCKAAKILCRKVGFVFQNPDHQIVLPIVEDDLAFGLKNLKLPKEEIKQRLQKIIETYELQHLQKKNTYHLSGGEKQMIAIAGVLAMEPEYLVFDEPTTLLDLRNRNRIQKLISQLRQPILMVTHDLNLLADFDRVIVLDGGKVIADDSPEIAINFYMNKMMNC